MTNLQRSILSALQHGARLRRLDNTYYLQGEGLSHSLHPKTARSLIDKGLVVLRVAVPKMGYQSWETNR